MFSKPQSATLNTDERFNCSHRIFYPVPGSQIEQKTGKLKVREKGGGAGKSFLPFFFFFFSVFFSFHIRAFSIQRTRLSRSVEQAKNILVQQLNHSTTYLSCACQHHAELTQSHTFAALIRLFTTTHNLLTFNTREISSNNSAKLSLFAYQHLWTFLLHSSYSSSRK